MSKKNRKKANNKTRDFFTDFYKTGREYSKENERRYAETEHKGWSRSEKTMLAVIILGGIGCIIKYVIL